MNKTTNTSRPDWRTIRCLNPDCDHVFVVAEPRVGAYGGCPACSTEFEVIDAVTDEYIRTRGAVRPVDLRAQIAAIARDVLSTELARDPPATNTAPTDGASAEIVLEAVLACACAWEPGARILGNVRAGDIYVATTEALARLADAEQQLGFACRERNLANARAEATAKALATVTAERDERQRDHKYVVRLGAGGCGDSGCVHPLRSRGGMRTNGGCQCLRTEALAPLLRQLRTTKRDAGRYRGLVARLLTALPVCHEGGCGAVATHGIDGSDWCSEHASGLPELAWAAVVRETRAALGEVRGAE